VVCELPEESPAAPLSVAVGDLWTPKREQLYEALAHRPECALLADLYRRGIAALNERPLEAGAVVIAGHCFRDLVNALPDVIGDAGPIPKRVEVSPPAQALVKVWETYQDRLGPLHSPILTEAHDGGPEPVVTVPVALLEAARTVAAASQAGSENSRRRRSALALGRQETRPDATVKVFSDSVSLFEKVRHPARGRTFDLEKAIDRISTALPVLEATLEARLGRFFASIEDLMDVLSAANQRTEAGGDDGQH